MEKKISEKKDSLQIAALQNDVRELKSALETKQIKEMVIAKILLEQDEKKLQKIASAVCNVTNPVKLGDKEEVLAGQGNK